MTINIRLFKENEISILSSEHNVRDKFKENTVEERKSYCESQTFPFWVMSLNMTGDLNIGTMVRSAHLFGAEKFIIWGRRKIDNRSLVGTSHYMDVVRFQAIDSELNIEVDQFERFCDESKLVPFFIEQGGENVFDFDWNRAITNVLESGKKPILIVGTESTGIPKEMLDIGCDLRGHILTIPQRGVIRSHNASMAFSIVAGSMISGMEWF